ncbi:MAG TPA: hypothetical protein VNH18_36830, partial [Bryobacteraceae bacterium]|nr:hypothetical protein [Bryobacteraceae bacterium]
VTFAAWSGLLNVALPILPTTTDLNRCPPGVKAYVECDKSAPAFYYSPLAIRTEKECTLARTWADGLFFDSGVAFVPLMLLVTGLAALIAIYGVARSVADEVVPPAGSEEQRAVAGGEWLTNGFGFMRWSQQFLYWGVLLFLPLSLAGSLEMVRKYTHLQELSGPFVTALGSLVGGTAIGLFAFGGRLSQLALGLRTAVRVALDVDNWLREHPHGRNPTARICARYVSLLRCIAEAKEPYDALVIFAHSQGTVITADLLRYIHAEYTALAANDPGLARLRGMKICLFTMGCPLRQLYGQRFPYLYGYSERSGTQGPPPEPADLNVAHWTNAYRTGDYVGRYLWRDADFWTPAVPFIYRSRTEVALGPGAHTHYWDHTADGVGEILDEIIAGA